MSDTNDTYIQMIPIRTTSDKINTVPVVDGQLIQLSDKGKLYYDAGTTRREVSGGHTIQDKSGTDLADQNTLQFAGYQAVTNDSTNGKTVVDNTPITITWANYQSLTSEQRQGNHYIITDIPSGGGSVGGGHVIEDDSGADMPQEENLQFVGVYTEDDPANDRTKVNIVREMTSTQMQALTTAQKKGFIRTTDEPDNPISGDILAKKTDIAPVESTSTASQRYEIGDQFYFNGQLVTATAIIVQGATITLNGNCTLSDSVTEQIDSLKNYESVYSLNADDGFQTADLTQYDELFIRFRDNNNGLYTQAHLYVPLLVTGDNYQNRFVISLNDAPAFGYLTLTSSHFKVYVPLATAKINIYGKKIK